MENPIPNNELLEALKRENDALRKKVDKLSKKQKDRKKSLRYMFSKKAATIIVGKGLKNSVSKLYSELPNRVSRDTVSDVTAHVIWRITRVGIFAIIIGITPLLILVLQTTILSKQNRLFQNQNELFTFQITQVEKQNELIAGQNNLFKEQNNLFSTQNAKVDIQNKLVKGQNNLVENQNNLFEIQNSLVKQQNKRIEQQTELIEADRRSSLVFLMGNIMDKIDEELKSNQNDDRTLSNELIGRISALSQSLKPYRYLKNDKLINQPLSPERGQLLLALVNTRLDSVHTYPLIYSETKFSRADLDEAVMARAYLSNARLNKADFTEATLTESNFQKALLKEAELKKVVAYGANFKSADLSKADLQSGKFNGSNFTQAILEKANLKNAELDNTIFYSAYLKNANLKNVILNKADLRGAYIIGANLIGADLEGAKVGSSKWLKKLKKWKVKGYEDIQSKYTLTKIEDDENGDYYILNRK